MASDEFQDFSTVTAFERWGSSLVFSPVVIPCAPCVRRGAQDGLILASRGFPVVLSNVLDMYSYGGPAYLHSTLAFVDRLVAAVEGHLRSWSATGKTWLFLCT